MERSRNGIGALVCPFCEVGEVRPQGPPTRCGSCGRRVEEAVLRTVEQVRELPDALGGHACDCGHPEMRRLPDGVYHCPACASEVLPVGGVSPREEVR